MEILDDTLALHWMMTALNSDAPATHDICSRIIHVFMCFYFSRKSLTLDTVVLQQLYLFRSEKHWHCLRGLW